MSSVSSVSSACHGYGVSSQSGRLTQPVLHSPWWLSPSMHANEHVCAHHVRLSAAQSQSWVMVLAHHESFRNHVEALHTPAIGLKVDTGLLRQPGFPGGKPLLSAIANIRILQAAEATEKTSTDSCKVNAVNHQICSFTGLAQVLRADVPVEINSPLPVQGLLASALHALFTLRAKTLSACNAGARQGSDKEVRIAGTGASSIRPAEPAGRPCRMPS